MQKEKGEPELTCVLTVRAKIEMPRGTVVKVAAMYGSTTGQWICARSLTTCESGRHDILTSHVCVCVRECVCGVTSGAMTSLLRLVRTDGQKHVRMHTHTQTHTSTHTYTHTHACACMYARKLTRTHISTQTHTQTRSQPADPPRERRTHPPEHR